MSERYDLLSQWINSVIKTDEFELQSASEDASFRSYHRLFIEDKTFIVMDAPPPQEDCKPFVKITETLLTAGINVPTIHYMDLDQGFLVLDDFGDRLYLGELNNESADTLYSDAINSIVTMQSNSETKELPHYDEALLRREMALFTDWLLEKYLEIDLSNAEQKSIHLLFSVLVENALNQPQCFVHRDYHSRNLMITKTNNPGVIDYQDAVLGPVSYDLVSLLKDCYIKWPKAQIQAWVNFYLEQRSDNGKEIERSDFQRWFDLMGVQRHLKASGIFARLSIRDGKHHFLDDVPRTLSYIVDLKNDYQELEVLCDVIETMVLPKLGESYS